MDTSDRSESSAGSKSGPRRHTSNSNSNSSSSSTSSSSRSTRFGGIKKAASSSSFFMRGLRAKPTPPPENVEPKLSMTSQSERKVIPDGNLQSQSSHSSEEKKKGDVAHSGAFSNLPFNEIGDRLKAAFKALRQDGKASELEYNRRLSRRSRNSFTVPKSVTDSAAMGGNSSMGVGYMQLRAATQMSSIRSHESNSSAMLGGMEDKLLEISQKGNFCDIEITGKDNIAEKAPSFLLACHSAVFEEMYYPKGGENKETTSYSFISQCDRRKLRFGFIAQPAIEAAIHFCASLELPHSLEDQTNYDASIRTLTQIYLFAQLCKISGLVSESNRMARRIINKHPSMVCALFDECNAMHIAAESENYWGLTKPKQRPDDLKSYVQEFMRESPMEVVLGAEAGVTFLSSDSIKSIICDQDMNVDEYTMWRILNVWVNRGPGTDHSRIQMARSLVSQIQLVFIDPHQLTYQVKKCGYIDPKDVDEALKEIELMLEKQSSLDKERVIVSGAGNDEINGIYVLSDDDIGLKGDEVMFLKEGQEDEDYSADYGLYRWGETWGISNCTDYFNVLYSMEVSRRKGHTHHRPPKWGWKCEGGQEPAPTCTWKPSQGEEDQDFTAGVKMAPSLLELKKEKKSKANDVSSSCGYAVRESLTLSQMMTLPEDTDYSKDNHRYRSMTKDLDAMMNLDVDEGYDDEEGGYNVNYMSATLFHDSNGVIKKGEEG